MHELSVATELYRACRTELEARGGGRLSEARIAVGELSAVEPELLRFLHMLFSPFFRTGDGP